VVILNAVMLCVGMLFVIQLNVIAQMIVTEKNLFVFFSFSQGLKKDLKINSHSKTFFHLQTIKLILLTIIELND
jgi:hypothetical protein